MLLAIDPGADAGWARFDARRQLEACGLGTLPARHLAAKRAVIERPHPHKTKAPVKDIITLAIRAGEWGGALRATGVEPEYIEPQTWKGQLTKDICHARIWARLSADEKAILAKAGEGVAPSKRHNIVDAVGIGLWALAR